MGASAIAADTSCSSLCSGGCCCEEVNNTQSSGERSASINADIKESELKDLIKKEKDLESSIMMSAFTEVCEKRQASLCQMRDLCFKLHLPEYQFPSQPQAEIGIRRSPIRSDWSKFSYSPIYCSEYPQCPRGSDCLYAHLLNEIEYHPIIYKTELCQESLSGDCGRKLLCSKAHATTEIRHTKDYECFLPIQSDNLANSKKSSPDFRSTNTSFSTAGLTNSGLKQQITKQLPQSVMNLSVQIETNISQEPKMRVAPSSSFNQKGNGISQSANLTNQLGTSQRSNSDDSVAFIDLFNFKTQPCKLSYQHNPKKCFFYHEAKKDRRRPLGSYTSEICQYVVSSQHGYECPIQDSCTRSHNRVEEFYHPEKYKVKFCSSYPMKVESCDYGDMCAFAHAEDEVTVDLLHKFGTPKNIGQQNAYNYMNSSDSNYSADFYMFHFKTVWCPYSDASHPRDACVYAHNWQDFRRKPHYFDYEREQCSQWETKHFVQTYADGCKNEYRCRFSHGWKEQEYHPLNYKMHACRQNEGCIKPHCPYYHNENDRRHPLGPYFKLFPKNRGNSGGGHQGFHQLYQPVFLSLLFNQASLHSQSQLIYPQIYGCGPQSVPILDPKLVETFLKSRNGMQNIVPPNSVPLGNQPSASTIGASQQIALNRVQSMSTVVNSTGAAGVKRNGSTLSIQSVEFKKQTSNQQQQPTFMELQNLNQIGFHSTPQNQYPIQSLNQNVNQALSQYQMQQQMIMHQQQEHQMRMQQQFAAFQIHQQQSQLAAQNQYHQANSNHQSRSHHAQSLPNMLAAAQIQQQQQVMIQQALMQGQPQVSQQPQRERFPSNQALGIQNQFPSHQQQWAGNNPQIIAPLQPSYSQHSMNSYSNQKVPPISQQQRQAMPFRLSEDESTLLYHNNSSHQRPVREMDEDQEQDDIGNTSPYRAQPRPLPQKELVKQSHQEGEFMNEEEEDDEVEVDDIDPEEEDDEDDGFDKIKRLIDLKQRKQQEAVHAKASSSANSFKK